MPKRKATKITVAIDKKPNKLVGSSNDLEEFAVNSSEDKQILSDIVKNTNCRLTRLTIKCDIGNDEILRQLPKGLEYLDIDAPQSVETLEAIANSPAAETICYLNVKFLVDIAWARNLPTDILSLFPGAHKLTLLFRSLPQAESSSAQSSLFSIPMEAEYFAKFLGQLSDTTRLELDFDGKYKAQHVWSILKELPDNFFMNRLVSLKVEKIDPDVLSQVEVMEGLEVFESHCEDATKVTLQDVTDLAVKKMKKPRRGRPKPRKLRRLSIRQLFPKDQEVPKSLMDLSGQDGIVVTVKQEPYVCSARKPNKTQQRMMDECRVVHVLIEKETD